jgi:hypothetical protein
MTADVSCEPFIPSLTKLQKKIIVCLIKTASTLHVEFGIRRVCVADLYRAVIDRFISDVCVFFFICS